MKKNALLLMALCLPLLAPLPSQAQWQDVLMAGDQKEISGYGLLNAVPQRLFVPLNQKTVYSVDKTKIASDSNEIQPGIVSFDGGTSTDKTGSLKITVKNDNGASIKIGNMSGLDLKERVYWLKILARGRNIEKPIAVRLKVDAWSKYSDRDYEELFAYNRPQFEWSYYIMQIHNNLCHKDNPIKNISAYLDFRGKGEVWIDKVELVDIGIDQKTYDKVSLGCGEDGKH